MPDVPAPLDAERFPQLSVFVAGYLHQDLVVCGGVAGAVEAWCDDVSADEVRALSEEWAVFLRATAGLDAGARGALLEAIFGGAWAPRSDDELDVVTTALTRAAAPDTDDGPG